MFIGIDVGGTNTRIVTSKTLEDIAFVDDVSFATPQDYVRGAADIINAIKSFNTQIDGIAIGLPGSINSEGILDGSTNLPDWVDKPLKRELKVVFSCPVHIQNDAVMGALGEAYVGQDTQFDFFYITWGTGVGCAQVRWRDGKACADRPSDRTPVYNLESYTGGNDIKRKYGKSAEDLSDEEWDIIMAKFVELLPPLVRGYGFEVVVIGGGIAVQQQNRIRDALKNTQIKTIITKIDGKAGLYGAVASLR